MTNLQSEDLEEYDHRRINAASPSEADRRLADQLLSNDLKPRIAVRWLANGQVDIDTSSWVGVVRFSQLEIRVVPKLVGGSLRVLRMLDYARGIDMLGRLPATRPLPANGRDLFDLICLLLVEETNVLLRDGVLRNYRATDDSLEVMRGRLRYREQYLRRFGQLDRLECHFDEYDSDTPDNQLIAAALRLARRRAKESDIRFGALRLASMFGEVCDPPTNQADWYEQVITYNRRNERYRAAHELSKLVLRGVAFDDMYDTSAGNVTAFMLDMNTVFEGFVTRLVRDAVQSSGLDVSAQARLRAVIRNDDTSRTYSTIKPDLVINEPWSGRSVPIDIKYKLYEDRKISTSDIYQAFLYAFALGHEASDRRAGVIYAAKTATSGPRLSIKPVEGPIAARIVGAGLDVATALDALASSARASFLEQVRRMVGELTGLGSPPSQIAV